MLQHLGITRKDVLFVERLKEYGVEDNATGVVEDANLILQYTAVDTCFATYRSVNH